MAHTATIVTKGHEMKPIKKKRQNSPSIMPTNFQLKAEQLAEQYVTNIQIQRHLRIENQKITEELTELMLFRGVPRELPVIASNNQKEPPYINREKFMLKLIDRRDRVINIIGVLKKLINSAFKKYLPNVNEDTRKKFTGALAMTMATFLRKDAVLASAIKSVAWGEKYVEEMEVKPYFAVYDDKNKIVGDRE